MKTWITYIAALLMGLATTLLLGDLSLTSSVLSAISGFLISLSAFVFIPVIAISFSAGIASLRKDRENARSFGLNVLWAVVTTAVLSLLAAVLYHFLPVSFPVTSTAGGSISSVSSFVSYSGQNALSMLYPVNPFMTLATTSYYILPIVIVCWIFGLSLNPSSDVIRPAYTVMNSFSEVMYRITRTITVFGYLIVFFCSADLFTTLYQEKTVIAAPLFPLYLAAGTGALVIVVLPLLFAFFTGFRRNPYRLIYRSISAMAIALVTGNTMASGPVEVSVARQNMGIQKRISSTSVIVSKIIAKGGTAFVASYTLLSLIQATSGNALSFTVALAVSAAAALASFASSIAVGYESVIVATLAIKLLGIELYGAEVALVAFIPLLNGISTMLDSLISIMSADIVSVSIGTGAKVVYRDSL